MHWPRRTTYSSSVYICTQNKCLQASYGQGRSGRYPYNTIYSFFHLESEREKRGQKRFSYLSCRQANVCTQATARVGRVGRGPIRISQSTVCSILRVHCPRGTTYPSSDNICTQTYVCTQAIAMVGRVGIRITRSTVCSILRVHWPNGTTSSSSVHNARKPMFPSKLLPGLVG